MDGKKRSILRGTLAVLGTTAAVVLALFGVNANAAPVNGVQLQNTITQDGLLTAELQGSLEEGQSVEYTWYRSLTGEDGTWEAVSRQVVTGSEYNVSEDGEALNAAYDSIAANVQDDQRYWYYVEATIADEGDSSQTYKSSAAQVPYYIELQNGSFETPIADHWNNQVANGTTGLVWTTTGEGSGQEHEGHDIELVRSTTDDWFWDGNTRKTFAQKVQEIYTPSSARQGDQFAELNCQAYGALYQDVLTVPGATLNWYLSHCARQHTNEMALVIMPVDQAEALTSELEKASDDKAEIRRVLQRYENEGAFVKYFEAGTKNWIDHEGTYQVPDGQYVTRFFFVAVDTGTEDPTLGNLLDRVGFGSDPAPVDQDEGRLTVTKVVSGFNPTEGNYSVDIAIDGDGVENDKTQTITADDFQLNSDGSYRASVSFTIEEMSVGSIESFDVTETVKNAPTTQYAETSQVTVGDSTKSGKKVENVQVNAGSTQQVTFTNTYEQYEQLEDPIASKKIRKNDDGTYTLALDILGDQVEGPGTVTVDPIDIVLVLDDSGSMADPFGENDPIVTYEAVASGDVIESKGEYVLGFATQTTTAPDYYAHVDGQYVQIDEITETHSGSLGTSYESHVRWELNGKVITPSDTQFYIQHTDYPETQTKTDALKAAVNSFIDQAAETNALIADQADKIRISVVPYASNIKNIRDFTVCEGQGVNQLKTTVSTLNSSNGNGATRADLGMEQAAKYLADSNRPNAKKVVILFTDGEPNDGNGFVNWVASDVVESSGQIKAAGGTVYTVGVFDEAEPTQDPTQPGASNFNRYMHAVSSNYPSATANNSFNVTWGQDGSYTNGYYKSAEDASQLTSVFEDIIHSETLTNGYSNVAITDTLTEYAEFVNADALTHNNQSIQVGNVTYYELTGGIEENSIQVVDGQGTQIDSAQYTLYINDAKTSIRVQFKDMLEDGKLYTLMFNVKPTAKAEEEYANTGYPDTGDIGTDMEGNDTSSGHKGFHTNTKATYEWNGQSEDYKHPVLQVDALKLPAFLQVTKTLDGADLTADEFHFTVTAVDSNDEPSSDAAKFAWGDEAETVVPFDSGSPDAGENTSIARTPEALVFSAADADKDVSYSYIYEETEDVTPAGVSFDKAAWKVTLTAGKTSEGDIKVDLYIYKDADGKDDGSYNWTLCSLNQDGSLVEAVGDSAPTHTFVTSDDDTMITIPFVNTFVGYGLEIYKGVAKEEGDTIIADPSNPLPSAQFTVYQVDDGTDMNVNSICTSENIYKGYQDETESDGYVTFGPFPVGTYYFKETRVPSGYQLMNQVIQMVVAESDGTHTATFTRYDINEETGALSPDGQAETKSLKISHDGDASVFTFDVANKPNPDLPSSGSNGTLVMMSTGFAAIVLAGAYLSKRFGYLWN